MRRIYDLIDSGRSANALPVERKKSKAEKGTVSSAGAASLRRSAGDSPPGSKDPPRLPPVSSEKKVPLIYFGM